jgi:hypothetical protein
MKEKSVAAIFNKPLRKARKDKSVSWPLPDQLIGIEVEVEFRDGYRDPENSREYWTTHRDGSLRNGTEYVLVSPMKGNMLSEAIGALFDGSRFVRSTTGSTHIHVDMTDETSTYKVVQVMTMLVYVLEGAFFAAIDSGREWCGYTNRLMSAPDSLIGRALNAKSDNDYADLVSVCQDARNIGRYYGCNLQALDKFGSIEFRYFPTAETQAELIEWIKLCMNIKRAAVEVGTTEALMEIMESAEQYDDFISTYFAEWKDVFLAHMPQWQASSNFRKGMAASAAWRSTNENKQHEEFNPECILNNASLKKFVKKNADWKAPVISMLFVPVSGTVPTITARMPVGTMLYYGELYILGPSRQWEVFSVRTLRELPPSTVTLMEAAIRAASAGNPESMAMQQGAGSGEAARFPRYLDRALGSISLYREQAAQVPTLTRASPPPIFGRGATVGGTTVGRIQRAAIDELLQMNNTVVEWTQGETTAVSDNAVPSNVDPDNI